jgi:hypothetical protein
MLTYDQARDALINALLEDAAAHEAERYDEIGRRFDNLEHRFPTGAGPELAKLRIALTFWDGWIDARNLGWQTTRGIQQSSWSKLARLVAADLAADREITDVQVRGRFDAAAKGSLGDRVQSLAMRLRERSMIG